MNKILLLLFTVLSCENLNFSSNYNSEDYIGMYKQRESNFIEKQRYFSSVTYYHSQNPSTLEELEI